MKSSFVRELVISCALLASFSASAEVVKRQMPACVTEDLLSELHTYAAKNDREGLATLVISGKCTVLRAGEQVSVIDPGFIKATIRYKGVKLYTPSEALR